MTLADDILLALPLLQSEAEGRMVDSCTITRGAGAPGFNATTGEYTDAEGTTIYTGPCEVQLSDGLNAATNDTGGQVVTVTRLTVKVPMSVEGVRIDDLVTITASLLDADLVGREYRVISRFAKTFATSRRFEVEETSL